LMPMVDTVIQNGIVFTMDDSRRVIMDGAVAITGNAIAGVGETGDVTESFSADRVIDAKGKAVLPGFVNVHTHTPTPHLRARIRNLMFGIRTVYRELGDAATSKIIYRNSMLSMLELFSFGSTTVKDNYDMAENLARAAAETGLRCVVSELVSEVDVSRIADGVWDYREDVAREKLEKSVRLMERWDGAENGRITTVFSPQAPDMVTEGMMLEFLRVARSHGKLTTIHLAQMEQEVRQVRRLYGKSPVKHLHDMGALGPDVLAAHCIYTDDLDTRMLAESGTRIMHCPVGQMRWGKRLAPVVDWLRSGITFGLGTDNIQHDMFTAMRAYCMVANHQINSDPYRSSLRRYAPTPMDALGLATIEGARTLGMDGEIGSLEAGKKADLIIVDMTKPHLRPLLEPASNLVWYGKGSDVETVMVDGRVLKDGEGVRTVDEEEVVARSQEAGEKLLGKYFELFPQYRDPSFLI
jgi:5-methylthioadenosine/S-adenosylhomocysteine deaminase